MPPVMSRRGHSHTPTHNAERCGFDALPGDILILISCQCRIDDLFALLLTSTRTRDVISAHIATIAPSVARSTFPHCDLLLTPPCHPSLYSIDWLKELIPQQLASILVDRHRFAHEWAQTRYGIPAEDPYGNELRARVANGWRVLRHLSNISKDAYQMDPKRVLTSVTDRAWKMVNPSRFKFELLRQREDLILKKRLEYIQELSGGPAQDYRLMITLLSATFRAAVSSHDKKHFPWVFDWGGGLDGPRLFRQGTSWLTWFVLHEGPDLFWRQWWILPPELVQTKTYIRDRSLEAWLEKTSITPEDFCQKLPEEWADVKEKWHDYQRDNAFQVHRAMEARAKSASADFRAVNPFGYFLPYAMYNRRREESGIPPVGETLSHVPFHVDFRCPEGLYRKWSMSQQQRARGAMTPQPRAG